MIEPRGAKHAYLYHFNASRNQGNATAIHHGTAWDVADSDDEAYGRAMRIAAARFPQENGFTSLFAIVTKVSEIEWVAANHIDKVEPLD